MTNQHDARPAPGRPKPAETPSGGQSLYPGTGGLTIYGIPNCDTVKKARVWLADHGIAHRFHDFKKDGVPAELDAWIDALGWEALVNRAGTTFRKLDDATKAGVTDATSARALMQAQPSVIKRPVVRWADGRYSVGFKPDAFAQRAAASA